MAFTITEDADSASKKTNVEPLLLLEIDGVATIYGARIISEKATIGAVGLTIGSFKIGGLIAVNDQSSLLTLTGTTTKITQNINPDTGASSSISSMKIALVDINGEASVLITPDDTKSPTFDLLGRKCKVWLGFEGTAWRQDFIVVFRGVIDEIDSGVGKVTFNIAHPDTKKRAEVFAKAETDLTAGITDVEASLPVTATSSFFGPVNGPDGTVDNSTIQFFVRIDDEIIRYEGSTATTFTSLTRGALGTTAAAHDITASVESFVRLVGDAMTLALKLMLSGHNGPYKEDVAIENVAFVPGIGVVANALFFVGVDVQRDFGLVTGDFVTTTGASNGANNVTLKVITEIVIQGSGSYLVIGSESFVEEQDTAAVVDFRSQYDTLGEGLKMDADEVDVPEHENILRLFLSSFSYDIFIKDTISEGKRFIEDEIYNPAGAFSLPRKSQASVGLHTGPLPGTDIQTLDTTNVLNPEQLVLRRSTSVNFKNTVTYQFEELALDTKFIRIVKTISADSLARVKTGVKPQTITSKGMRTALSGVTLAAAASNRRLRKYKFGAEYINNVSTNFKTGFRLEVGDIVLVDIGDLKITDIQQSGSRAGESRLFQIDNKGIDFKTGRTVLKVVDTNFDKDARLGTISPASIIKSATSNTTFVIEESFSSVFGANEFKKWENLKGKAIVKVHNTSYSTSGTALLSGISGNTITVATSLGFTPSAGMIMDLDVYDNQPEDVKLLYAFFSDGSNNFADGGVPYKLF